MDKFNYVIARRWFDDSNQLSCYSYGATVFYGNMEDAMGALDFIRGKADEHGDDYEIYKISDKPLKID